MLSAPDAACTIGDVAEVINRLWGHNTPGGRLFFIRSCEDELDAPRGPDDLLSPGMPPARRWYAMVADSPSDARSHVRNHEADSGRRRRTCRICGVTIKARLIDNRQGRRTGEG